MGKGRQATQTAIDGVMANPATPEKWKEQAISMALDYLRNHHFVLMLEIRAYCEKMGLPTPHNKRVWGGIALRLCKMGAIDRTDRFVWTGSAASHTTPRSVWESLIYAGEEKPGLGS